MASLACRAASAGAVDESSGASTIRAAPSMEGVIDCQYVAFAGHYSCDIIMVLLFTHALREFHFGSALYVLSCLA